MLKTRFVEEAAPIEGCNVIKSSYQALHRELRVVPCRGKVNNWNGYRESKDPSNGLKTVILKTG